MFICAKKYVYEQKQLKNYKQGEDTVPKGPRPNNQEYIVLTTFITSGVLAVPRVVGLLCEPHCLRVL